MLEQLIKSYPEVTRAHVLSKIDPTSLLLLRRCSRCVQQFVDRNSSSLTSFSPESSSSVALSTTQNHKFKPSEFASSINLIEYAIECGCPIDRTRFATFAARFGNIDVIRYLVVEKDLCEWDWRTTQKACEFGHVELLKWLRVVNCVLPFEFSTAPISVVSVDPNLTLIALTYWPGGTRRSSTLLFILPATKFVFTIGILL